MNNLKSIWELISEKFGNIAYIDIETTGLSPNNSKITTIAVYDGKKAYDFIQGENLEECIELMNNFDTICTFNGKRFDIPFMNKQLGWNFTQIHFDLMEIFWKIGIKGGLKKIEKLVGISRGKLDGFNGRDAIKVWKLYKSTMNRDYLNVLLTYNREDVINMEYLLHYAYNKFRTNSNPELPILNYSFDNIDLIRKKNYINPKIVNHIRKLIDNKNYINNTSKIKERKGFLTHWKNPEF